VGADRIAANGDTANKIGTYSLALVAKAHNIPFFVAAPCQRLILSYPPAAKFQLKSVIQEIYQVAIIIAPPEVEFYNPAFDVTPAELITAIITEHGAFAPGELQQLHTASR